MLQYTRNTIAKYVDHPLLILMYLIAGLFGLAAGVVQILITLGITGWDMGAAFLAIYMIFFAMIGTVGYAILFLAKGISLARDRVGPTN